MNEILPKVIVEWRDSNQYSGWMEKSHPFALALITVARFDLGACLLAALVSTGPVDQLLIAVPAYLLFEASLLMIRLRLPAR